MPQAPLKRYVYLRIFRNAPLEIQFFPSRDEGLLQMDRACGSSVPSLAYWSDQLTRAERPSVAGDRLWLYEVDIS